jgi:hypothetical protein
MKNLIIKKLALSVLVGGLTMQSCNTIDTLVSPASSTATTTASAIAGSSTNVNVDVPQANLLSAISAYLTANYAGFTFVNAYSEANTIGTIVNYDVNITVGTVAYHVVFDATGVFVKVGTHTKGSKSPATVNVAVIQANLLGAISTYLTANYAGFTFVNAYSEANAAGTILNYDVNITMGTVAYHIVFDAAGVFVKVGNNSGKGGKKGKATTNVAVTQANLLGAISTYLTANYAGYTFVNAYSEADAAGTIVNFDVNITSGGVAYHVVFDATGVFVKVGK